ncbi:MAG: tetratricopeptide repeat protein [Bacteroidota bacterium]
MIKRVLPFLLIAFLISCNNQQADDSNQKEQLDEQLDSMKEVENDDAKEVVPDTNKPGSVDISLSAEQMQMGQGHTQEISVQFRKGTNAYANDDFEGGINIFKEIITQDPDNRKAYYNLGVGYFETGKYHDALKSFDNAVAIDSEDALSIQYRGRVYYMLGDFQNCLADYERVVEVKPEDPLAWYNRGTAKGQLKNYLGAIKDFDKAIELNPDYAEAYFNRGLANHFQGRTHEACYDWRHAHSLGHYESEKALRSYCEGDQ